MTVPVQRDSLTAAGRSALGARVSAEQGHLRTRSTIMLTLAAVAILVMIAAVGVWILGEGRWMILSRVVPFALWGGAAALAVYVVKRLRTRDADVLTMHALAGAIEREQRLRSGSLRGALEVADRGVFGARAAQDVSNRLPAQSLTPRLTSQLNRSMTFAGVAAVGGAVLLAVSAQQRADGFSAMVHPIKAFRGTLLPALGFDRLPASVPRGMPLTVHIAALGRQTITVSRRAVGESWSDTTLSVGAENGMATLALGPVRTPVSLRVADGRSPEAHAIIAVDDRGWIGDVALFAQYPSYLGRTSETLDAVSPIRVPRGTRVRVTAVMQGGVTTAALQGAGTVHDMVAMGNASPGSSDGTRVSAEFTVDHDGAWGWSASAPPRPTGESLPPELPDSLSFLVTPDLPPEILIASPVTDTAIGVVGEVPVMIRAGDDHGVANVSLVLWLEPAVHTDSASPKREHIDLVNPDSPFFEGGVTLPLDGFKLQAGDRIHLIATATDNSPWRQITSSREVILRVPTVSEQRAMARSLADSLVSRAQQMAQDEKRLQQNTADASRSRELQNSGKEQAGGSKSDGNKGAMSFQAAEKARELAKKQEEMMAKIDSLRQSTKDLENKLKSASALDTALANRMRDIQKMLRDAVTPEMQKQLEALNKNADQLSAQDAQQTMQQLSQQQQQMRQQLEKSAEMLKRAALEGAMSTLSDEASELADAQRQLAGEQPQNKRGTPKSGEQKSGAQKNDANGTPKNDPNSQASEAQRAEEQKGLADRARTLQDEVEKLTQRLQEAGAKPGASRTQAAEPMVQQAADAMDRAASEALKNARAEAQKNEQAAKDKVPPGDSAAMEKALQALKDEKAKSHPAGQKEPGDQDTKSGTKTPGGEKGQPADGKQAKGQQSGGQQGGQQQGAQGQQQQAGQQGQQGQSGRGGGGSDARQAGDAMDKAAQQLSAAREAQVDAWKTELSDELDKSISETQQLARQQADLERRAKQGGNAQSMQGEQGAVQQGVKQAAERLEKAARSSSLLSQRSQKAMADAQQKVGQSTQSMGQAGQPGGSEQAQNAMKDATDALNQALSSLVRDRERINNAESASGFTEMMEQLKKLAQQQGALNGQMQGLNLLPGGAQGQAAQQQARVLARQQRDVAKTLNDVSDADQTGRTDALAKEAQMLAQQMERAGLDASVAARQQQLYRRLLDAGRFLEQDERDDEGAREAKAASGNGARNAVLGAQSGKAANKFAPPTWNELRGLDPEDRRLVIEYFRKLNGSPP